MDFLKYFIYRGIFDSHHRTKPLKAGRWRGSVNNDNRS